MKSYNHLWEKLIHPNNIKLAIQKSSLGKRDRKYVKKIYQNPDKYIEEIIEYTCHYTNYKHKPITIYDSSSHKERQIIVPKYKEQIIHHMIIQILQPIFMKGMYEHSYASIPNRGGYLAMKQIKKWIKNDARNVKYCLKMDIRKFFDSITHNILERKLAELIHDTKFTELLYKIIEVTPNGKGIPLGFYTSQWFANWYLQGLDHYIKEKLGAVHYIRYMDDMVIFGSNKKQLHIMKDKISEYLNSELGLQLKGNWQVFRFDYIKQGKHCGRCLDFIGYKFYRNKITLRKRIMCSATRTAKRIYIKKLHKKKINIRCYKRLISYMGWITNTDTYNVYKNRIKPYANIKLCKQKISDYDKRYYIKERNERS